MAKKWWQQGAGSVAGTVRRRPVGGKKHPQSGRKRRSPQTKRHPQRGKKMTTTRAPVAIRYR